MTSDDERDAQAQQLLDAAFDTFGNELAFVLFEAQTAISNFAAVHSRKTNAAREAEKPGDERFDSRWRTATGFDLLMSPAHLVPIGVKSAAGPQVAASLVESLNNQLQWMLVAAYEAYEAFVRELFAVLGYLDKRTWNCQHFGNVPLDEIEEKDLEWHRNRVRQAIAKHDVAAVLKVLRSRMPDMEPKETVQLHDVPLSDWINIVGLFRHSIVHSGGKLVLEYVARKLGKNRAGRPKLPQRMEGSLKGFVRDEQGRSGLWLVAERGIKDGTYVQVDRLLDSVVQILSTHALLLYRLSLSRFGLRPGWDA